MAGNDVAREAAASLLARKDEFAHAVTDALYRERPELLEKYGERGRAKCLQDIRYNIEHLAPAVELAEPELFARYAGWLRDMLGTRGIAAEEVHRSLELTRELVRERLDPAAAQHAVHALDAGLASLK